MTGDENGRLAELTECRNVTAATSGFICESERSPFVRRHGTYDLK